MREAFNAFCVVTGSDKGRAACLSIEVVPALLAALKTLWKVAPPLWNRRTELDTLILLSVSNDGRDAFLAANAAHSIVLALTATASGSAGCYSLNSFACRVFHNLARDSAAGAASCVTSGAVSLLVALVQQQLHDGDDVECHCEEASQALFNISRFASGVAACLTAGAVARLAAAYVSHDKDLEVAKRVLRNLGFNARGIPLRAAIDDRSDEEDDDEEEGEEDD